MTDDNTRTQTSPDESFNEDSCTLDDHSPLIGVLMPLEWGEASGDSEAARCVVNGILTDCSASMDRFSSATPHFVDAVRVITERLRDTNFHALVVDAASKLELDNLKTPRIASYYVLSGSRHYSHSLNQGANLDVSRGDARRVSWSGGVV